MTTRTLAEEAGVHPVYLARCVRRWYGRSIGEELRRARLGAASLALASDRDTISGVAHGLGFADQPHLTRSFRASTGFPPHRFRRLVSHLGSLPTCT